MQRTSPGERIETLRLLLGFTQEELAELTGLRQGWVSEVERGHRPPSDGDLAKVAAATNTPLSFFSAPPRQVPQDSLKYRSLVGASRRTTSRVRAYVTEIYRLAEELTGAARYPRPQLPTATGDVLTPEEIEALAARTREALRLPPDEPILHVTRAAERGGVAVAPIALVGVDGQEHDPNGHMGASCWDGPLTTPLICYFPSATGDRDRFTLAHELGHLVLHTYRPLTPKRQAEDEAHRFAGALLVPWARAREELAGQTLTGYAHQKARWGVSIQALIMRAHAVGVIDDTRKRSLFVQLSARGWRRREPVPTGHEVPLLLRLLAERRHGDLPVTRLAEKLGTHPWVLRAVLPPPAPNGAVADDARGEVLSLGGHGDRRARLPGRRR